MDVYDDPSPAGSSTATPSGGPSSHPAQPQPATKKRKKMASSHSQQQHYQHSAPGSVSGGRDDDDAKKKGYSCSECHRRKVRYVAVIATPLCKLLVQNTDPSPYFLSSTASSRPM